MNHQFISRRGIGCYFLSFFWVNGKQTNVYVCIYWKRMIILAQTSEKVHMYGKNSNGRPIALWSGLLYNMTRNICRQWLHWHHTSQSALKNMGNDIMLIHKTDDTKTQQNENKNICLFCEINQCVGCMTCQVLFVTWHALVLSCTHHQSNIFQQEQVLFSALLRSHTAKF